MNTVTAKLSSSTWAGLSALALAVVLMFVCLFSVAMLLCHPTLKTEPDDVCKCPPAPYKAPLLPTEVWDWRTADALDSPRHPINTDAASEKKYGNPLCPTCPQTRRYPTYVQPYVQPQPTYVQPYVQPNYVQPAVAPPAAPVVPHNPTVVSTSDKCQIALFLDNSQQSTQLKNWFDTDPKLVALKQKCTFEIYTSENALYRSRYSKIVPVSQFPVVLFQYPNGGHIHAAGQATIPQTAAELYSHLQLGYKNAQSVKNASVPSSGSEIMSRGYNFDADLQSADCPDGKCPVNTGEDESRWHPGDRIRDLFPAVKDARQIMVWGGTVEIVVYVALAAFIVLGAVTFTAVALLVVVKVVQSKRNQE